MHNHDDWQQLARQLTGTTPAAATPNEEAPPTGPVIPGQEKTPNMSQGLTPEQRTINRIFNAGTIREHY